MVNYYYKSYLIGFILSGILIITSFAIVVFDKINRDILIWILIFCAITQVLIRIIYFMHIDIFLKQQFHYLMSLLFVILIINTLVIGSLWIMFHLNYNLMFH